MPVTAGRGQPGLETNLLSVGSVILYVVSYHLLGVRGRARLLLLPRPEKNTASDDVLWTDRQRRRQRPADALQSSLVVSQSPVSQ